MSGLVGLSNLGNTCYVNSILQVLSNCNQLRGYIFQIPLSRINYKSQNLLNKLIDVIDNLWTDSDIRSYRPISFLSTFKELNPSFSSYAQQDAQEFLRILLNQIKDEILPVKNDLVALRDLKKPKSSKLIHSDEYFCFIDDIFQGKTISIFKCYSCHNQATREESFMDLSLSLVQNVKDARVKTSAPERNPSESKVKKKKNSGKSRQNCSLSHNHRFFSLFYFFLSLILSELLKYKKGLFSKFSQALTSISESLSFDWDLTLENCLDGYFSMDLLKDENSYFCSNCKKFCPGSKQIRLKQLPEILTLHLKRFRVDSPYGHSKATNEVSFPLRNLDLSKYLHHDDKSEEDSSMYDLFGVVCHLGGGISSGHYTAIVKNCRNGLWYQYNDDYVTKISEEQVLASSSEAYLLFYQKNQSTMSKYRKRFCDLNNIEVANEPSTSAQSSPVKVKHQNLVEISREWLVKFETFSNPGPITFHQVLCPHKKFQPILSTFHEDLFVSVTRKSFDYISKIFSVKQPVDIPGPCNVCTEYLEKLEDRREAENKILRQIFENVNQKYSRIYHIDRKWFCDWIDFVKNETYYLPGPLENIRIRNPFPISEELWEFLRTTYGNQKTVEILAREPIHQRTSPQRIASPQKMTNGNHVENGPQENNSSDDGNPMKSCTGPTNQDSIKRNVIQNGDHMKNNSSKQRITMAQDEELQSIKKDTGQSHGSDLKSPSLKIS